MSKTRTQKLTDKRVHRRAALKGLGALAISGPVLSSAGCSTEKQPMQTLASVAGDANGASGATGAAAGNTGNTGSAAGTSVSTSTNAGAGTSATSTSTQAASGGTKSAGAAPGGASGNASAGQSASAGTGGDAGSAGMSATDPMRPPFADAASCTLTATDIEGPFYIDDAEVPNDISLIRSDVREGLAGVETRFYFRLLDAKNKCAPIAGAQLYIWHCNADGYYSGFDGQDPTQPYMGSANPSPTNLDRFCRGVQVTGDDGVASFITIYPGWYAGRPIHVHLTAQLPSASMRMITTQLYFAAVFTKDVHTTEPAYMARAANIPAGSLNPAVGKPMPTMKHTPGLVTGTLNVIVNRG